MRRIHSAFRSNRIYVECIVQRVVLANHMTFRIVIAPCIEIQILAARQVVLLINLHPFANQRLFLRRQLERTFRPIRIILRIRELRSNHRTGTDLRSKVHSAVCQLYVVAVVSQSRSHRCVRFAFHTYLTRTHRVGSYCLVDFRNQEIVHRATARTNLNDCIGLVLACLVVNLAEIRRHLLRSIPRALQTRSLVIIGQTAVQVLTVDLQAVEVPALQEHLQQVLRIRVRRRIHRRQIPAIPPCDIFVRPLLGHQQHLRMVFQNLRTRVSSKRCPP